MKFAYSLAASLASFFLLLLVTAGFLAMSNRHDRQYLMQFVPRNRPDAVAYAPPVRSQVPVIQPTQQPTLSSPPPQQITPPANPAKPPSERLAIEALLNRWKTAWENLHLDEFISCYAPSARVYKNQKWYDFDQFRSDEAQRFAKGGTIHIDVDIKAVDEGAGSANLVFSDVFHRTGGGQNEYKSRSIETWKLAKNREGQWLILEDRSDPVK